MLEDWKIIKQVKSVYTFSQQNKLVWYLLASFADSTLPVRHTNMTKLHSDRQILKYINTYN